MGDEPLDYHNVSPIVAAARIFDTFAAFEQDEPEDERRDLSIQAAVCYAMYGNFPAANSVVNRAGLLDSATPAMLAVMVPVALGSSGSA